MSARVADVMTKDVMALRASASFKEIAARLREQRVSAFAVLDADNKVIGVVSEADLLPKEALEAGQEGHPGPLSGIRHRREREKATALTAADLMSRPPVTVGPYDLLSHAAHLLYDHRVRCLPVVDHDGRLAGMLSREDVLGVFGRPDEEIRREIIDKIIAREFRADPARFTVTVADGVVTLGGVPETAAMGQNVASAVRHIVGVVAVYEEFTYFPRS
jgi:CBS domain-containing protein